MEELRGGNSEALSDLYVAFADDVFHTARRVLGADQDAQDVTHDVFVGLPAALRSYDHYSGYGFERWLERRTVRLAWAHTRRSRATRTLPLDAIALDATPAAAAPRRRPIERIALERALGRLSPAVRAVFLLKEVAGYSHREISAMLDISVSASGVRLFRAREALRGMLGDGAD